MSVRKLVVWDYAWAPYEEEFARRLGDEWRVVSACGGLEWLVREIEDASALVAIGLPAEARSRAKRLEVFLFPGAGVLQTDPETLPEGCLAVNVYEHETPIAEYALMMMLAHVTKLRVHLQTFSEGRWDGSGRVGGAPHDELAGKTVGLIGYGRIGRAVGARASALGMRVAAYDGVGGRAALEGVLEAADFLVIAAPLTEESRGMIGEDELGLLPEGAFLVNVSRAEIVAERPLYRALESGRLGGAALDVWYQYPAPGEAGHGSRFPFHRMANVYCTPHYSAWSKGMILRRIARMCENLGRMARGEELERVVMTGTWRP